MLRVGLVINPIAGVGGPLALKGSDHLDDDVRRHATRRAAERVVEALVILAPHRDAVKFFSWAGDMGEDAVRGAGLKPNVVGTARETASDAEDTRRAVATLCALPVDLLLFAGGDGTARDVLSAMPDAQLALGVPAGVKMHSSVFAVTPRAAGEVLLRLVTGGLAQSDEREVRDIDEQALRAGTPNSRRFGFMRVPTAAGYLQQVKQAGRESDQLVLAEIVADLRESMRADTLYLLGAGSTLHALKSELGVAGTLLGVDATVGEQLVCRDANEEQLLRLLDQHSRVQLLVSPIAGQGMLFGRGNQQLSPRLLRRVTRARVSVIAGRSKLLSLEGRPLLMDSGDAALDREWCGLVEVIAGYQDRLLYRLDTIA